MMNLRKESLEVKNEVIKHQTPPSHVKHPAECLTNTKSSTDCKLRQSQMTQDAVNGLNMIGMFDQLTKNDNNVYEYNNMAASN